ncbi:TPA: hypothetical protein ACU95R_005483 [Pseudomonas aeruginosa]
MAFIAINLPTDDNKELFALEVESFIRRMGDAQHYLIIYEPQGSGRFVEYLEELGVSDFSFSYVSFCLSPLDVEILSYSLGRDKWGERYLADDGKFLRLSRCEEFSLFVFLSSPQAVVGVRGLDSLDSNIRLLIAFLAAYDSSPIISDLRVRLIALENIFNFFEIRSCLGECQSSDSVNGISRSVQESIAFIKRLELAKSIAFKSLLACAEHLRDGKLIHSNLVIPPRNSVDYIFFRKINTWSASLHLAHAVFLSLRQGYSNEALHHCVRALECYLSGVLVASRKVDVRGNGHLYHQGVKVSGVGLLLRLSPVPASPDIEHVVSCRNRSELAHGSKRWKCSVSRSAVEVVKNFIVSIDAVYAEGDFIKHYRKAASVDFVRVTESAISDFLSSVETEYFLS